MSVRFNFVAAFGRKPQIPSAVCQPPLRFARGWHSARTQPVIFGLMILLAFAFAAQAQNASHLGYVYPAGGRQASTFTVVMGGQFPSGITNFAVVMDGNLAQAKIVAYNRPLKPMEQQALKEELN